MQTTFYLFFSHNLTKEQTNEIKNILNCQQIVALPKDLQELWSNIPAGTDSLINYLAPFKKYLEHNVKKNDYVLVQGDFGATFIIVNYLKLLGARAVYATTKREVIEKHDVDTVTKQSVFKHVKFRKYEE